MVFGLNWKALKSVIQDAAAPRYRVSVDSKMLHPNVEYVMCDQKLKSRLGLGSLRKRTFCDFFYFLCVSRIPPQKIQVNELLVRTQTSFLLQQFPTRKHHPTRKTIMTIMWRSKLGNEFPKEEIDRDEKKHKAELDRLRKLPANRNCADCGEHGTHWASVNLGVFLCMSCGAHHVGMGTHVSLPKECCTGAYLWGPDEIQRLAETGNAKAAKIYGGLAQRPLKTAPYWQWRQYITDKYEHKKFVPKHPRQAKHPVAHAPCQNLPKQSHPVASPPKHMSGLKVLASTPGTSQEENRPEDDEAPSPKGVVLRPAAHHRVLQNFLKSPHHRHALGGHAIVRVMAHADSMDFDSDDDWTTTNKGPTRKNKTKASSPTAIPKPVVQNHEMQDDFFRELGL